MICQWADRPPRSAVLKAGSYGLADTRGLIRTCTGSTKLKWWLDRDQEDSMAAALEEMAGHTEKSPAVLGLPRTVIILCTLPQRHGLWYGSTKRHPMTWKYGSAHKNAHRDVAPAPTF